MENNKATYSDLMAKFKASKSREEKAQKQIEEEKAKQKELLPLIQNAVTQDLGQNVMIGSVNAQRFRVVRSSNTEYNRDAVVARIVELRAAKQTYDQIAEALNNEGLKPQHAEKFSTATVHQIFKNHKPLAVK